MSITVCYFEGRGEIQFDCSNADCPVRTRLMDNLAAACISFRDNGASIYVNHEEFLSTDDMEEKALAGFKEIKVKEPGLYDPTGTAMVFGYTSLVPLASQEEEVELILSRLSSTSDEERQAFKKQVEALQVNSKELLDAYYDSLDSSPSLR
jgi:hypothetical protein